MIAFGEPVYDGVETRSPRHRILAAAGWSIAIVAFAVAAVAVAVQLPTPVGAIVLGALGLFILLARPVTRAMPWMIAVILVIMFFPIRRFAFDLDLGFALEPYRIVVPLAILGVLSALLFEPRFRYRRLRFGWTLLLFILAMAASIMFNGGRLIEQNLVASSAAALINIFVLFSVFFLTRQLLDRPSRVETVLTVLVGCGVVVAAFALVERVTGVNYFWQLDRVLPLVLVNDYSQAGRGGGARSFASAQHPIALAMMLLILIPVALWLARHARWPRNLINRKILYCLGALVLLGGVASAVSRTSVVAIGVAFLVVLALRPYLAVTLAAACVPILGLGYLLQPKLVNEMIFSFFNLSSLIESQYSTPGYSGAGRLADIGPAMEIFRDAPIFGEGYGSRIVTGPEANAFILDNQYLGTMLDAGLVGLAALILLFVIPVYALGRASLMRDLPRRYRDLALALAASMAAFAAGSYLFDAFAFIQVVYVWSILLAVGGWLLVEAPRESAEDPPSPAMEVSLPDTQGATTP